MTDTILLAWLADALEPGQASEVAMAVQADPAIASRVALLGASVGSDTSGIMSSSSWRIPPPGIWGGRQPVALRLADMTMDASAATPVGFSILIATVPDPHARWVVVLRSTAGGWKVLFPTSADERIRLDALPEELDGTRTLDMVGGDEAGTRFAVALPTEDADWGADDPWASLRSSVASGGTPVSAVELRMQPIHEE